MYDLRPNLGVEANLLRRYRQKKTGEYRYSKVPIVNISTPEMYSCRETLVHRLKSDIESNTYNNRVSSNSYMLMPLIATSVKGRLLLGESNIVMELGSIRSREFFNTNSKARQDVLKGLNYVLGIMGVCLSNPSNELVRRNHLGRPNEYSTITVRSSSNTRFEYGVLSSFWLVSPVMVSIITGMARNVLSAVYDERVKICKDLFGKITLSEINSIIRKQDKPAALKVYKNILVPFFEKHYSGGDIEEESIFLGFSDTREVIDKLIYDGCFSIFKPENCVDNWLDNDDHYGLFDFMDDLGNPRRDSNWDRFR